MEPAAVVVVVQTVHPVRLVQREPRVPVERQVRWDFPAHKVQPDLVVLLVLLVHLVSREPQELLEHLVQVVEQVQWDYLAHKVQPDLVEHLVPPERLV